jgi:hypothetical protein
MYEYIQRISKGHYHIIRQIGTCRWYRGSIRRTSNKRWGFFSCNEVGIKYAGTFQELKEYAISILNIEEPLMVKRKA